MPDYYTQESFDDIPHRRRKMGQAEKYPEPGIKRCCGCYEALPLDRFGRDSKSLDGKSGKCLDCVRVYIKRRYEAGAVDGTWHRRHLKNAYGLSPEEHEELLAMQGGVCAICGSPPDLTRFHKRLHIDHDHKTGRVRGLLCNGCNTALGGMQESPSILRAGADYLERHGK